MELASSIPPEEDQPPQRPEGVFEDSLPPLPTYTKILTALLDEVNKTLDERRTGENQRYKAFIQELNVHIQKIEDLQVELAAKLSALGKQGVGKITSESYHVGFDSSHINNTTIRAETGHPIQGSKVELLNPGHSRNETSPDADRKATTDDSTDSEQEPRVSPAARIFAQIPASDYRASCDYLLSNPGVLQHEPDTDGLLIGAYRALLHRNDETRARQCVHQGLLLQYCRLLGRDDGVALFFKRVTTPGHQARGVFEGDIAERLQKLRAMAARDRKTGESRAVEQVQLYPTSENSLVRIQVPPVESEDAEARKARQVFDEFPGEMRAALESGSLEEVNKVLAEMGVSEAETMVGLLDEAGCLSIEEGIIDATTDEGRPFLRNLADAGIADAEPAGPATNVQTEATPEPK